VSRRLAPDREFYARLRAGRDPGPRRARPPAATVSVVAPFNVCDGYGSMAEYLVLGMRRAGARVTPVPLSLDPKGLSDELLALLADPPSANGGPVLFFSWPSASLRRFESAGELFINTMWEASRLPAGWSAALNRARAVIVPTRFVAQVCRDSGVTAPVEVVPEGIDAASYGHYERRERETFTTLIVAPVVERKHTREGIAAWQRAFAGDPNARLVIKARFGYRNYRPDDDRIRFVDADEKRRGIARYYHDADVLLALGNEGFGLPLVEGMATGLPVIALDSEGQADVCEEAGELVLGVRPERWQECDDPPFGPAGVRGVPGVADVAERLRWVAGHRDEARELGRAASAWALSRRDLWDKGPAVLAAMEQHARPPRTLRRVRKLWTTTWGTPCGVAEYVRDLLAAGAPAEASAAEPDLAGVSVLHVQHEPCLFRDADLLRIAAQARAQDVPMVVTEHAVTGHVPSWEGEVSALVSPSAAGADTLKARWPGRRVEHIPLGCPTWFPPRKQRRERVIGAFGFLEPHKGFTRLLELVSERGDVELLVCSHAKRPAQAREWEAAIAGLPVRWLRDFRSVGEVARLLAADADVLVYWYDEAPVLSASGAVRVGLATGVPVIASPTAWFDDLRTVTYQPASLPDGVERLFEDTPLREDLAAAAQAYCHEHRWPAIAQAHRRLWASLGEHDQAWSAERLVHRRVT
jgi:glycosyltransferase involved in cell wall biosynthesis